MPAITDIEAFFEDEEVFIEEVIIPLTVVSIKFRRCGLRKIPKDFFMKYHYLEDIDLYANSIESLDFNIPNNVTNIDLSYNRIRSIETDMRLMNNIEKIDLSYNFLDHFPEKLNNVNYTIDHNNIETKQIYVRNLKNPLKIKIKTNVHDSNIQTYAQKSIKYLLEKSFSKYPRNHNYINRILDHRMKNKNRNPFITLLSKFITFPSAYKDSKILNKYNSYTNKIVYDYNNNRTCTMSMIIERIWAHAKNSIEIDSIIENLFIQMEDGDKHCFVGKYTRLVNTLSSFVDEVGYEIPVKTKISNKIISLKNSGTKNNKIIEILTEYMNELNVSEEDQAPWLEALEEI